MRLRELLEGLSKEHESSAVKHRHYANVDQAHACYRLGLMMAVAGDGDPTSKPGTMGEIPTVFTYSKGDEKIMDEVEHLSGIKNTEKCKSGSKEHDSVHKVSPVAKPKKNKWGI